MAAVAVVAATAVIETGAHHGESVEQRHGTASVGHVVVVVAAWRMAEDDD